MAIPNPNPNIADGLMVDNKTLSSNKIYELIMGNTLKTASIKIEGISKTINPGTINDILFNEDITSMLPEGATLKGIIVEDFTNKAGIARQWVSGTNKISISAINPTSSSLTISAVTIKAFYI